MSGNWWRVRKIFGSTLNPHLHFHCVVIDGVFDAAAAGGVIFHAATGAPPRIAPARGPPLWDLPDAGPGCFDPQPAPEYEFDQRITW